jgi:hypothetical protein
MTDANASAQAAKAALAIYDIWHERAKGRDVRGLLELYAPDAVLESPLVPRILPGADPVLRGREQIGRFLRTGTERRPNELVRWHRTGEVHWNGRTLMWEYPRATPDGDQVDIVEVMELDSMLIARHRIYWGWFGTELLIANATGSAREALHTK